MELLISSDWALRLALIFVLLNAVTALFIGVGFALERTLARRQIFAIALRPGQRARELRNTLMFQLTAALAFTAFMGADLMRWTSGWAAGLTTFFACWLGFEIYYYAVQREMHLSGLFRFHREHHESRVNTPLTAFSMSIPESLVWIAGYILVPLAMTLLGLEVSLAGWLAYLVYNYWGNILGHVNVEVLPAWVGRRVHSWTLHAITFHALHHARYAGHFGFGATFMDRWLASEWKDWPGLHSKVLAGEALTHFKQRGIRAYEDGLHGLEVMAHQRQTGNGSEVVLELLDDQWTRHLGHGSGHRIDGGFNMIGFRQLQTTHPAAMVGLNYGCPFQ